MNTKTDNFITKYKNAVILASRGTGIFPSVTMAQMILESGWGAGQTARLANNMFGIKADAGWHGKTMLFNTPNDAKKQNYFRSYDSPQDSVLDHEHFLIQNGRYKGALSATTPEQQAQALAAAGYAESKNYATTLISLINAYNLKALDPKPNTITPAIVLLFPAIFAVWYFLTD